MTIKIGFAHAEKYGRNAKVTKDADGKVIKTVRAYPGILEEAGRGIGAAPHLANPLEPQLLLGVHPLYLSYLLDQFIARIEATEGGLHPALLVLYAVVASFPVPMSILRNSPGDMEDCIRWIMYTLDFFRGEMGGHLCSVVGHADEEFYNLHLYGIPDFNAGERNLYAVHPGLGAFAAAAPDIKDKGIQFNLKNRAYAAAMVEFQNRFYEGVSVHLGHARSGPGRDRLTRRGWRKLQLQLWELTLQKEMARRQEEGLDRDRGELHAFRLRLDEVERELQVERLEYRKAAAEKIELIQREHGRLTELGIDLPAESVATLADVLEFFSSPPGK